MKRILTIGIAIAAVFGVYQVAMGCCGPYEDPPAIESMNCSPNVLWPPNHKYTEITVSPLVLNTDTWEILSIVGDQPDDADGIGDGQTTEDCYVTMAGPLDPNFVPNADYPLGYGTCNARAERCGVLAVEQGLGRTYTITVRAWNSAGEAFGSCSVYVPHDRSENLE